MSFQTSEMIGNQIRILLTNYFILFVPVDYTLQFAVKSIFTTKYLKAFLLPLVFCTISITFMIILIAGFNLYRREVRIHTTYVKS